MANQVTNISGYGKPQYQKEASVAIAPGMYIERNAGKVRPHTSENFRGAPIFAEHSQDGQVMRDGTYAIGELVSHDAYDPETPALALLAVGENVAVDANLTSNGDGYLKAGGGEVAASLNTGVVGDNNAITFTAIEAGVEGNDISVELSDPGGASQSLSVDVVGKDITVNLATDGSSDITSTAAQVIAAVLADEAANLLVTAANTSTSTGAGVVVAEAAANLSGGADTGEVVATAMEAVDNSAGSAAANIRVRVR